MNDTKLQNTVLHVVERAVSKRYRTEKTRMLPLLEWEEQMGNYLDFWLDKERSVSDYRCFMRDFNCVRLWNENCMREREREKEKKVDSIYYIATFTGSLVKKFRDGDCSVKLVIEKLPGCSSVSFSTWPWTGRRTRVFSIIASSILASRLRRITSKLVNQVPSKNKLLDNGFSNHPTKVWGSSLSLTRVYSCCLSQFFNSYR